MEASGKGGRAKTWQWSGHFKGRVWLQEKFGAESFAADECIWRGGVGTGWHERGGMDWASCGRAKMKRGVGKYREKRPYPKHQRCIRITIV